MTTHQQIRNAIKAKMETVANVGVVHSFERYAAELAGLRAMYVSGGKVMGWYIRLQRTQRASAALGRTAILHTWIIRGFRSFDDSAASELAFDDLIEALQEAFQADETLGQLVGATVFEDQNVAGLQRDDAGPVMFAGVLCHSATLRLNTLHHE